MRNRISLRRLIIFTASVTISLVLFLTTIILVHRWIVASYGSFKPDNVIWLLR
jgi:hypothetical protein